MTVWEVDRRANLLERFVDLLYDYYNNVVHTDYFQAEPNDNGLQARREINAIMDEVRVSMYRCGIDTAVIVRDPPAIGGRSRSFSLLDNLYLIHQFDIDPIVLIDLVEQAIGKYKGARGKAVIRTFNPFFWLNELLALLFSLPFRLLVSAGLVSQSTVDSRSIIGLLKSLLIFIGTLITYSVGIVTIAEKLGYLNALKKLIEHILRLFKV